MTFRPRNRRRQVPNRPRKVVRARRALVDKRESRRDTVGIRYVGVASSRTARDGGALCVRALAGRTNYGAPNKVPHRNGTAAVGLRNIKSGSNRHTTHHRGLTVEQADGVADTAGALRGSRRFRRRDALRTGHR